MPDNRQPVFNRSKITLQRLKSNPSKLQQTVEVMGKYLSAVHVEQGPYKEKDPPL